MRKFSLDEISRIAQILAILIPVIFLVSGFTYTNLLFHHLGFGAGSFLSFADYIILNTFNVLWAFLVAPISAYLGYYLSDKNKSNTERKKKEEGKEKTTKRWYKYKNSFKETMQEFLILWSFMLPAVIFFYLWRDYNIISYGAISMLPMGIVVILAWLKKIQINLGLVLLATAHFAFLPAMVVAESNAKKFLHNNHTPKYELSFSEGYKEYSESRYITTTSEYVFLFNHAKKEVEVIPKDAVISYRQINKQEAEKTKK